MPADLAARKRRQLRPANSDPPAPAADPHALLLAKAREIDPRLAEWLARLLGAPKRT